MIGEVTTSEEAHRAGLSFGQFRLYPPERLLERDGVAISLGGRALDLLICLTEKPGEIITKRELIERVWPDVTVEESSLRFHIVNLRKALGDGQGGIRYITNVSGRGYCFVAPVVSAMDSGAPHRIVEIRSVVVPHPETATANGLPRLHERIIGRDDAIEQASRELIDKRFVTLHGPGGIGKTTVAVAIAHQQLSAFKGHAHFLDLGTISEPDLVASTLASSLGLTAVMKDSTPAVIDFLRERRLLIVFDCCEHVIDAVAQLAERIYREAPKVCILATSRERLRVEGERAISVASLVHPPIEASISVSDINRFAATQLFADRAGSAFADDGISDSDAKIIAGICRKLDGNALAIELVAGQVATYGLRETANLLDSKLGLQFRGRRTAAPRHQTLKATVEWSYQLLGESQKSLLECLSIFTGPFSLTDAEVIGSATNTEVAAALEDLVEKSLVVVQRDAGTARYRLLDSTRAYCYERLFSRPELQDLRRRHAGHVVTILQKRRSENLPPATAKVENRQLLGDASAALRWSFSSEGDGDLAPILAAGATSLFISLSMLNECRRWCEKGLEILPVNNDTARTAMVLNAALGHSLMLTEGNRDRARLAMQRALELAEQLDDKPNQFRLLCRLHMYFRRTGEVSKLVPIAKQLETLANALGDPAALSAAHTLLSVGYHLIGKQRKAETHIAVVFHLKEYEKVQPSHYAFHRSPYIASARCKWLLGFPDQARMMATTLEDISAAPDAVTYCIALIWGASVFQWTRDWKRVDSFAKRLIGHARDHSLRPYQMVGLAIEGETLLADGQLNAGLALIRSSVDTLHAEQYELYTPRFEGSMARALLKLRRVDEARALIEKTLAGIETNDQFFESPDLLRIQAKIMAEQGDFEGSRESISQAIDLADKQGALSWRLRAAMSNVRLLRGTQDQPEAVAELRSTLGRFTEGFETPDLVDAKELLNHYSE